MMRANALAAEAAAMAKPNTVQVKKRSIEKRKGKRWEAGSRITSWIDSGSAAKQERRPSQPLANVHALVQIMKLSERSVSGVAHVNVQGGDAPVRVSSGPLLGITTRKQLPDGTQHVRTHLCDVALGLVAAPAAVSIALAAAAAAAAALVAILLSARGGHK
eukprot:96899-Pelagomonas_calceolata.AAC.1